MLSNSSCDVCSSVAFAYMSLPPPDVYFYFFKFFSVFAQGTCWLLSNYSPSLIGGIYLLSTEWGAWGRAQRPGWGSPHISLELWAQGFSHQGYSYAQGHVALPFSVSERLTWPCTRLPVLSSGVTTYPRFTSPHLTLSLLGRRSDPREEKWISWFPHHVHLPSFLIKKDLHSDASTSLWTPLLTSCLSNHPPLIQKEKPYFQSKQILPDAWWGRCQPCHLSCFVQIPESWSGDVDMTLPPSKSKLISILI